MVETMSVRLLRWVCIIALTECVLITYGPLLVLR